MDRDGRDGRSRLPGQRTAQDGPDVEARLAELETSVYVTLVGCGEGALALAEAADALDRPDLAVRARLLFSDVLSRSGRAAEALALQQAMHDQALAHSRPLLAARAALYLTSTAHRLGLRLQTVRWAGAAQLAVDQAAPRGWRAEALMVLAMMTVTHEGFAHDLVEHALSEVRSVAHPVLTSVSLANLAEVAAECDDLELARRLAEEAVEVLHRHPDAAATLTWESVARVRLACGDLLAADRALTAAFAVAATLGVCDVIGEPYLTLAELRFAQGRARDALAVLDDVRRPADPSSWVAARELRVRGRLLAGLGRWQEAYTTLEDYLDTYEQIRSAEAERAAAETQAAQTALEERLRARRFEELALRDALTGLPNRRYVMTRLAQLDSTAGTAARAALGPTLSVAILDIDHFKAVNDTWSHDVGDLVLTRLGALLRTELGMRELDLVADATADRPVLTGQDRLGAGPTFAARLGGEEFVLVLPATPPRLARERCEHLLAALRATTFEDLAPGLVVTASIGLVSATASADAADLLRWADACLYDAKRSGRDRVVAADRSTESAAGSWARRPDRLLR
jgi:two-component system cell cycle response regulator